jgi:hypothetical protein
MKTKSTLYPSELAIAELPELAAECEQRRRDCDRVIDVIAQEQKDKIPGVPVESVRLMLTRGSKCQCQVISDLFKAQQQ